MYLTMTNTSSTKRTLVFFKTHKCFNCMVLFSLQNRFISLQLVPSPYRKSGYYSAKTNAGLVNTQTMQLVCRLL